MQQADASIEILLLDDCPTDCSATVMHALEQRWHGYLCLLRYALPTRGCVPPNYYLRFPASPWIAFQHRSNHPYFCPWSPLPLTKS